MTKAKTVQVVQDIFENQKTVTVSRLKMLLRDIGVSLNDYEDSKQLDQLKYIFIHQKTIEITKLENLFNAIGITVNQVADNPIKLVLEELDSMELAVIELSERIKILESKLRNNHYEPHKFVYKAEGSA